MMRRQAGATLVELMISLVLSLVVIGGIGSLFLQMQKVSRTQHAVNNIVDDSRYALELLQKEIRRTGGLRSKLDANGGEATVFYAQDSAITIPSTDIDLALGGSEFVKGYSGSAPASDAFVIRYQLIDSDDLNPDDPSNSSSPCTQNSLLNSGDAPALTRHVVSVYFFVSDGSLRCASQRSVDEVCVKNCALSDTTPVTLIDNVQSLTVRYGIDSDSPRDRVANYYVDAQSLESGDPLLWQNVTSIRLSLVLKSESTHLAQQVRPYTVEDTTITPSDHALYRAFSTTIALRNQL
jgi:type IV pilus assembly protein PilW